MVHCIKIRIAMYRGPQLGYRETALNQTPGLNQFASRSHGCFDFRRGSLSPQIVANHQDWNK